MNSTRNVFFAIILLIAGTYTAAAQKVCHVASQELVENHPKSKAADKALRDLAKTYAAQLDSKDKELKAKYERARQQAVSKSKEENERVRLDLEGQQKKLDEFYQSTQQQMAQKREDLLKPIYKEVRDAIQKAARAKGYDYVLDSTTGTGLILADGYDLTPEVKKALGIK